eukprot:scaffold1476_cov363-Prasinococcus_capsulatus_cf.AAC.1
MLAGEYVGDDHTATRQHRRDLRRVKVVGEMHAIAWPHHALQLVQRGFLEVVAVHIALATLARAIGLVQETQPGEYHALYSAQRHAAHSCVASSRRWACGEEAKGASYGRGLLCVLADCDQVQAQQRTEAHSTHPVVLQPGIERGGGRGRAVDGDIVATQRHGHRGHQTSHLADGLIHHQVLAPCRVALLKERVLHRSRAAGEQRSRKERPQ